MSSSYNDGISGSQRQMPGPFFHFQSGVTLSHDLLVKHLRQALGYLGVEEKNFAGHSFRSGAATAAAAVGLEDSVIKTLGHWQSSVYQLYVKIPRESLAAVPEKL